VDLRRDITERKQAEEVLHESHEKLKELDKLKINFLNVAYHEMRSPLGPILASASLLEQGYLTAKQKRLVYIIEQSVKQLEKLINRLLELTRIDAGPVELRLNVVSIPEIVKNVLGYLKPLADAKKQSITIDVPERTEIEGDEQKITAIFDNLVSNAIKHTEKNGRIDIKVADRGGEDIVVSIADTGIGISEEHLSKVFERFFMADTSLSRKGGLGLGLSIVQEYVKLHGGKVWATSELGKGSNFFFTVPKKAKKKRKKI
ncbi:MAG: HAMP domain-containing histidine kinase, partial [Methanophagales archaeon]|nr:HAMP domain-containing histidine kinase [Methanophagales archaeon]